MGKYFINYTDENDCHQSIIIIGESMQYALNYFVTHRRFDVILSITWLNNL